MLSEASRMKKSRTQNGFKRDWVINNQRSILPKVILAFGILEQLNVKMSNLFPNSGVLC